MIPGRPTGAYGFTIRGFSDPRLVEVPSSSDWPEIHVSRRLARPPRPAEGVTDAAATIWLLNGSWARLNRRHGTATLMTGSDSDEGELLHPFLAAVAVVFAWWHGRLAFHGGAFVAGDGPAWALLGGRGAGKSSSLAGLANGGLDVLTDDLLVVDRGRVFAGPRIVDLRPDAAETLGAAETDGVRGKVRRRIALPSTSPERPLGGWVFLSWGQKSSVRRLGPSEWLGRAASQLNTITTRAPSLLELAGSDVWEVTRPRTLGSLEATVDQLRSLAARGA